MLTGKEMRLNKLFKHSQRLFTVPMDHGITVGPITGLTDMPGMVKMVVAGGADAVIVHKGLVKQIVRELNLGKGELIVHLSASTSLGPEPNQKELVSSVEHAIRLGATAVSVHVNLGSNSEAAMIKDMGQVAEYCDLWGMPLLAMMYVRDGNKENEFDPTKIKHAARVAEEVGADIIKVNYTGTVETFREVTGSVKVPVIIAGGQKLNSTYDLLVMIADALKAGAKGVSIGRNVFQNTNPALLVKAIRKVLDEEMSRDILKELAKNLN
ncbi:MAG: fructose-bisphosphate aldolase, class [Clostridia bacterium]|jgi:predicted phospho-2-dehydro-3-deoxyheptonate aldolase|nr:fructose-bisphosphate aldolase, class [Clostridia bacterium]